MLSTINLASVLLWGFAATVILTTTIVAAQSVGLTRIDMPFVLGTMVTPSRDVAKVIGLGLHLVVGWAVALLYALFFASFAAPTWWIGALLGLIQGVVVCVLVLPLLPGVHPRMVSDSRGPEPTRLLEPPGFLATNYGRKTPIVLIFSHILYGTVMGAFYLMR